MLLHSRIGFSADAVRPRFAVLIPPIVDAVPGEESELVDAIHVVGRSRLGFARCDPLASAKKQRPDFTPLSPGDIRGATHRGSVSQQHDRHPEVDHDLTRRCTC